jgi:hypothetical protein
MWYSNHIRQIVPFLRANKDPQGQATEIVSRELAGYTNIVRPADCRILHIADDTQHITDVTEALTQAPQPPQECRYPSCQFVGCPPQGCRDDSAKEAFSVVSHAKYDALADCDQLRKLAESAHASLRQMSNVGAKRAP